VEELQTQLQAQGLEPVRLHTSHAFHSSMMEPALEAFVEQVSRLELKKPQLPYLSNVSGTWVTDEQATDPAYWAAHLRQGVRFSAGIEQLLQDETRIYLEIGPGNTLSGLVRQQLSPAAVSTVFSSLRHPREAIDDAAHLMQTLGGLWQAGSVVDWSCFSAEELRRRVPLPTYPFERQRYWIETASAPAELPRAPLTKRKDITDWLYVPSWKRTPSSSETGADDETMQPGHCLLFAEDTGLAGKLQQKLQDDGYRVHLVRS
jgi:acyl transferase domain-containing protein